MGLALSEGLTLEGNWDSPEVGEMDKRNVEMAVAMKLFRTFRIDGVGVLPSIKYLVLNLPSSNPQNPFFSEFLLVSILL